MTKKQECIDLAEQARTLIDELHTEQLNHHEYNLLRDAVDMMQNYIESKRQQGKVWISCKKRMPKEDKPVFVCVIVGERAPFAEPAYHKDDYWWSLNGVFSWPDDEVSHWMLAPKLPKMPKDNK